MSQSSAPVSLNTLLATAGFGAVAADSERPVECSSHGRCCDWPPEVLLLGVSSKLASTNGLAKDVKEDEEEDLDAGTETEDEDEDDDDDKDLSRSPSAGSGTSLSTLLAGVPPLAAPAGASPAGCRS